MWFLQQQATGNPLTDLLLQEKAMEICGQHGSTSFTASRGWLRNFKKRYAIRFREKKSVQTKKVQIHEEENKVVEVQQKMN